MTPNTPRLRTLAAALINEATFTGTHKFHFNSYFDSNSCGTSACAIGLCPSVWPDHWERVIDEDGDYRILLKGIRHTRTLLCTREWFSLDGDQQRHLFQPGYQYSKSYGYPFDHVLYADATAAEVAATIIAFCDHYTGAPS